MELASDLSMSLDPVEFFKAATGFEPDPWQRTVLESSEKKIAINCSRQSGKTCVVSALALWTALFDQVGETVVIVAPSLRQSTEAVNAISTMYKRLTSEAIEAVDQESALRMRFKNGSRIIALPGSGDATVRGLTACMVIVDEASRVLDETMSAVRPFLATKPNGRLITLSTPWWSRGWWYEAWQKIDPDWLKVKVTAAECSRIDPKWLASERAEIGEIAYQSEFCCEFLDSGASIFSDELIAAAFDNDIEPLWS